MITTADGILPRGDSRTTGENAMWRVKVTWKGRIKSGTDGHANGDGGLYDRHLQAYRGWPSVQHRTMTKTK